MHLRLEKGDGSTSIETVQISQRRRGIESVGKLFFNSITKPKF